MIHKFRARRQSDGVEVVVEARGALATEFTIRQDGNVIAHEVVPVYGDTLEQAQKKRNATDRDWLEKHGIAMSDLETIE